MMKKLLIAASLALLGACTQNKEDKIVLMDKAAFETTLDGKEISLWTLRSGNGLTMQVTNFGGRVVSLWTPDRDGNYEDIVLGHPNINEYINYSGERCLGSIVGPFANRIAEGKFEIEGTAYQLPLNNNGQTLHGGPNGLDMKVWDVQEVTDNSIVLAYTAQDGDEGYPGTLDILMTYTLTPQNEFRIDYKATTDKPTHINLSHHTFFNLKGEGIGTNEDNLLQIKASAYTPVNEVLIPTGEVASVEGTPFDFRTPTAIGARINEDNEQLQNGGGYDHNWVLDRDSDADVEFNASLYDPSTGRYIEVWSDQPAMQFYSGNFLDGAVVGKYGRPHNFHAAVALETQKYPDTPNQPGFPSTRLDPGEVYTQTCIYKFSAK